MSTYNLAIINKLLEFQNQIENSNNSNNVFKILNEIKTYINNNFHLKDEYEKRIEDVEQVFQNKQYMKHLLFLYKIIDKLGYTPTNLLCDVNVQKLLNVYEVKLLFNLAIARIVKDKKIGNKKFWLIFNYIENNYNISNFDFFIFGISTDIIDNKLDDNTINILKYATYSMLNELIKYAKALKNVNNSTIIDNLNRNKESKIEIPKELENKSHQIKTVYESLYKKPTTTLKQLGENMKPKISISRVRNIIEIICNTLTLEESNINALREYINQKK